MNQPFFPPSPLLFPPSLPLPSSVPSLCLLPSLNFIQLSLLRTLLAVLLASGSPAELQAQLGAWHKDQVWLAVWWMQTCQMMVEGPALIGWVMEEGYSGYPLDFVGAAELPSLLHQEALEGVWDQVRQDTA